MTLKPGKKRFQKQQVRKRERERDIAQMKKEGKNSQNQVNEEE